ncbi:M56 family metallopeptidase [Maribacter litopenaei]|uniref:M56 family metallopeptidase n=1 Tax=Maribacter litopenaei TaxID=2976127 RepID=A0ABY5Y8T9_9FLAO|nr:M56 family metallopeptidase [Maribacter litopenaei]UWX55436.1 M56 family metallopeptidase [Maribacter litopenaei]
MLVFLAKSTACLVIFLIFYKLLLEKENMHHFKRIYLLSALAFSFLIPSIVFTEYVAVSSNTSTLETPNISEFEAISNNQILATEQQADWETILWCIYGLGVLLFGIRFILHIGQLWWRIRRNPRLKEYFTTRVLLLQQIPPHTFFNYIFLNREAYETQNIPKEVLLHEETHAKQWHSLDIILVELAQIIFWFNPLIYLLKSAIKLNHEFLADSAVVKNDTSIPKYQHLLLSFLSKGCENYHSSIKIANAIVYSSTRAERSRSIKKRFTVMKTKTSKKSIVLRSFLLLPLTVFLLFAFSTSKEVYIPNNASIEILNHSARSLNIEILGNGNYLVEEIKVDKDNLVEIVNQFNSDINTEIRNNILNIHLTSSRDISNSEVLFIYKSLFEYGFYRIVTPNQEIIREKANTPFAIENEYAGRQEIEKYNTLAMKYNAIPVEERKIPFTDLKVLETIYDKMSDAQKKEAQPFPECLPKKSTSNQQTTTHITILINKNGQLMIGDELVALENLKPFLLKINKHLSYDERKNIVRSIIRVDTRTPKNVIQKVDKILTDYGSATINIVGPKDKQFSRVQQSATREEMKEYNALAKKYNEMDRNHMVIKNKEIKRLKELYGKMSKKQQADAEPFPNFPPPPPAPHAPKAPKNVSDTEYASNEIESIIDTQDPYDVVSGPINLNQTRFPEPPAPTTYIKAEDANTPPPPPEPISPIESMEKWVKDGADFFLNGTPISQKKHWKSLKTITK